MCKEIKISSCVQVLLVIFKKTTIKVNALSHTENKFGSIKNETDYTSFVEQLVSRKLRQV